MLKVKNLSTNADVQLRVWSLGQEDPLEESMATHFSILAWRIPQTEYPGGLQSTESQSVAHDWSNLACTHTSSRWFGIIDTALRNEYLWENAGVSVSSVAQSCLTLWDPMDWSTPGFPVHHQLLELAQTLVHWLGDAIQPSHCLLSPFPPAFNLSQHSGSIQWVSSSHQEAKVLEFQLQHQSFQWLSGTDFL